jgi:hypothetical protein
MDWLKRNWKWLVGGTVAVAVVGGAYYYSQQTSGAQAGLGCGCGLGHSGRTATYRFPSGRKHGHYSSKTRRFHRH